MKQCDSCVKNNDECPGYVPTAKTGFLTCDNYKHIPLNEYPCRSCIKTVNSCYYHNKIVGVICDEYKPNEEVI